MFVLLPVLAFCGSCPFVAYQIHPAAGVIAESVMTYQMLATKCLKTESMKVYKGFRSTICVGRERPSLRDHRKRYGMSG